MQDEMVELLHAILDKGKITTLFQPIIGTRTRSIFGYEALSRGPSDSPLHSPLTLFDTAAKCGRLVELDLLCRQLSIQRFAELGLPGQLFLNVMPNTLLESNFREGLTRTFLDAVGMVPNRVVIELTEHTPIHDYDLVRDAVAHYRTMGFQVALDDLGAGYSSLRHWAELRPDFVKIDGHFVQDLDRDPLKQQFLESLLEISHRLQCQVIAEGIETSGEYHSLWGMNCPYLQGYYFCRPAEEPPRSVGHMLPPTKNGDASRTGTVRSLCVDVAPLNDDVPVLDVAKRFKQQPGVRCLPVVRAGRPIGVVRQQEFLTLFTNQFSHALYSRRLIRDLLDNNMIVAREDTPLESLSQTITESKEVLQQDFVIVDTDQRYLGMGNIVDLLREITAIQVRSARHANPLTGLPGNILINEMLNRRIGSNVTFAAIYCDIDNFKAYNDTYGYARGDEVISALARLLQDNAHQETDFIGHVGGDDFILLMDSDDVVRRCHRILKQFEALAPSFYSAEDVDRGGLYSMNRRGRRTFFPLMSISTALLYINRSSHQNALDVANDLTALKKQAKKKRGNNLFIDRRTQELALAGADPTPELELD